MSNGNLIVHRLLLIFIVVTLMLSAAQPAYGSLFRSATLSWKVLDPARPNVVTFHLQAAIRWSFPDFVLPDGSLRGPYPPVGTELSTRLLVDFLPYGNFGAVPNPKPTGRVLHVDAAHDFFIFDSVFTWTYPETNATYTPVLYGSARGTYLLNGNAELSYWLQAQIAIDMSSPHDSPVVTMPEIISVPRNLVTSFLMGAYAPQGGELTYSIPPVSETQLHAAVPYRGTATNRIPIMSLDPQTGLITWDTRGESSSEVALGQYAVQLRVADAWGNYTFREFVVNVIDERNGTPPGIGINGSPEPPTLSWRWGTPVTFEMRGTDADFDSGGLPQQVAFLDPGSPETWSSHWGRSPVTRTAQWAPPSWGTYTLPYWIVDSTYMVATVPVTINVTDPPKITCNPPKSSQLTLEATSPEGATLDVSGEITDHDSASVTASWLQTDFDDAGHGTPAIAHTDSVTLASGTGTASWTYKLGLGWHVTKTHVSDEVGESSEDGNGACVASVLVRDSTQPVIPPLFPPYNGLVPDPTSYSGGVVTYVVPDATDVVDGAVPLVCTPASGSFFPMGYTTVGCTATDRAGNRAYQVFHVHLYDAPPVIQPLFPPDNMILLEATSPWGRSVHYDVPMAHDALDGDIPLSCAIPPHAPPLLVQFGLGDTPVRCGVTDKTGHYAEASFIVRVRDTTPPVIPALANLTFEATSSSGTVATFTLPTATDAVDGVVALVCTPASGSHFPIGNTSVSCSATDKRTNAASASFTVTVRDSTPPVIPALANITTEATSGSGAVVTFSVPAATDALDGERPVTCTPASGNTFPLGTNVVSCTATDRAGNIGRASFTVTVRDTTPPVIGPVLPSPQVLWPPNHQIVPIAVNYSATDNTGATCTLTATSNEPDNGLGDGDTPGDIRVVSPIKVELRAERAGNGEGRVYVLGVRCADAYGNASTALTSVTVPKSMATARK